MWVTLRQHVYLSHGTFSSPFRPVTLVQGQWHTQKNKHSRKEVLEEEPSQQKQFCAVWLNFYDVIFDTTKEYKQYTCQFKNIIIRWTPVNTSHREWPSMTNSTGASCVPLHHPGPLFPVRDDSSWILRLPFYFAIVFYM